jgi:uncharacterized protein YcfJ
MTFSLEAKQMKLLIASLIASIGLMTSTVALADRGHGHGHKHRHHHHERTVVVYERPVIYERHVYARVVSSRPIYREVAVDVPYQSCGVERVGYRAANRRDSATGAIVGGVIGAAIGHEVGGRHDALFAGLAGASIGHSIAASGGKTYYEDREVCSTSYRTEYRRELVGYDVGYDYNGRVYYTESSSHPGSSIRVDLHH